MHRNVTRRQFIRQTTVTGATFWFGARAFRAHGEETREKLKIGLIGTANRAKGNIEGVRGENIVALCDVDDIYLGKAQQQFPSARTYNDFREMLKQPGLEAVVISTPDHIHAVASMAALKAGLHVYCEKPLTHSVYEARTVAETAKRAGKATQMGTQIHAGDNYRRVVELVQSGAIGPVTECHVWVHKGWGGGERPTETPPVPPNLHWDLWLGPAPERPYHPTYLPGNWRRWWDFGGGTLGDMGCHYMDLPFWALKLAHPLTVEAEGPPLHPETCSTDLQVRYEFPAREGMPPVRLTWYDGELRPDRLLAENGLSDKKNGVLFVGEKGLLWADYDHRRLLPADKFADFEPPAQTIPASIGHHAEWIQACKTASPTTCNFLYGGRLTETVLLGNVAYRTGKKLEWDSAKLRAKNAPEAARFIQRAYREGWAL